jgi:environmental stress-induced protein Ves
MYIHIDILLLLLTFESSECWIEVKLRGEFMERLLRTELVDVPWKNGGGVTRNIATGQIGGATAWRISRADVDVEGPFSNFTGLTRILTVVSQNSMDLEHKDGVLHARAWEPLQFDGGMNVTSHLKDGPLTDLNLMFDPRVCTGTARVVKGSQVIQASTSNKLIMLHVLAGEPKFGDAIFERGDTMFLDASDHGAVEIGLKDAVLELTLQALDQNDAIKLCIADR